MSVSEVFNIDNMIYMATIPDKFFDLVIADPPYGIGFGEFNRTNKASDGERYKANKYKNTNWDCDIPSDQYFEEIIRISVNQIVWGGNYFPCLWLNGCKGFIYWHKGNPVLNFSDGELAWTSFNKVAKQFDFRYYGNLEGSTSAKEKHHPTQKPVKLYKWLLSNYAKQGDKIFDPNMGSQSSRIAAYDMGFDFWGCELDKDYFEQGNKRFENFKLQLKLL